MPCYNSEKFIGEAITSILSQSFSDFEILIIDGYSSDDTLEIIKNYPDQRIKIYKRERKGIGDALGFGCSLARGKYIARMDSDDISLPFRFEKELNQFRIHKDAILVSSSCLYIDDESNILRPSIYTTAKSLIKYDLSSVCHPSVMILKKAYEKSGGYVNLIRGEDNYLWRKLSKYGSFYIIKEPLIKYRLLPNSLNKTLDKSYINILSHRLEKLIDINNYEEEICIINAEISKHLIINKLNYKNRYPFTERIKYKIISKIGKIAVRNKVIFYSLLFIKNFETLCKKIVKITLIKISI